MKLAEVEVESLFVHRDTGPVRLADGLTVVVGPNGAGKTALALETACWVLWGKTARGTRPDGAAIVQVDVVGGARTYAVRRVVSGRKLRELTLVSDVNADLTGQTPTETQGKIDALVGSWDRFCSTRVFSARLRARLGTATDKERKALLEDVLGLERHERAAKLARAAAGRQEAALAAARQDVAASQAALEEARRALAALPPAPEGGLGTLREQDEMLERLERDLVGRAGAAERAKGTAGDRLTLANRVRDQAISAKRDAERYLREARDGREQLLAEAKHALTVGDCPVCLTPAAQISRERLEAHWQEPLVVSLNELADAERRAPLADAEVEETQADFEKARLAFHEASRRVEGLARDLEAKRGERRALAQATKLEEMRAGMEERARDRVARTTEGLAKAGELEALAESQCVEAEAVARVLGSKGARVLRMRGALARLGREANAVLARMPVEGVGPIRLVVEGTRELAGGGEVDEVSIRVEPAELVGGGEYAGASDGERVRLDVALMLGMARVAGDQEGLVIFDEVFDSLDDVGLDAVTEFLVEMAQARQVLVITHNPRFLDRLPSAAVWRVSRASGAAVVEQGA